MTLTIRSVHPEDHGQILEVVRAAFSHGDNTGDEEVDIVKKTWVMDAAPEGFDLVAIEGGKIVGHVMVAQGDLAGAPAQGLAPLCVAPGHQISGVGSALMAEIIQRVDGAGWPFLLLLGNPAYYGRFEFESAAEYNIQYQPVGTSPAFQIRRLKNWKPTSGGSFLYCFELT